MRRIVIALGTTLSGLVLLFSWPTSLNRTVGATAAGAGPTTSAGDTGPTTSAGDTGSTAAQPPAGAAAAGPTGTYVGAPTATRWGPVQVRITVADGVLTAATAVEYPVENHRDQEINAYAIPVLEAETLDVQGAGIDLVSGATVTSRGYVGSLQDALDQAGL